MRETLEFIASTNFEGADDRAIAIIAQFLVYRAKEALAQPDYRAVKTYYEGKPVYVSQPEQEPVLQDIEQYRLQMAGISTAAIGYWKEGDGILPDYDTVALRDVAKLYAKYDALYKAQPVHHAVIAGALFDFMGYLTSRPKRIMLSSADEASPAVDAIRDFANMRGLSLDDAKVQDWNTTPPKREWVGLTDEEVEQLAVDAGIITWVKKSYDTTDRKFYDLPLGEGMEGDEISLKQFANLVSTRLKEKNT